MVFPGEAWQLFLLLLLILFPPQSEPYLRFKKQHEKKGGFDKCGIIQEKMVGARVVLEILINFPNNAVKIIFYPVYSSHNKVAYFYQ